MERKKVALPVSNGNLCAHFGHCEQFVVFETIDGKITSETFHTPPAHQPGVYPGWLHEMGVSDVIAGGMGQRAIQLFMANHINVYVGAHLKSPRELVNELLDGSLRAGENLCDH